MKDGLHLSRIGAYGKGQLLGSSYGFVSFLVLFFSLSFFLILRVMNNALFPPLLVSVCLCLSLSAQTTNAVSPSSAPSSPESTTPASTPSATPAAAAASPATPLNTVSVDRVTMGKDTISRTYVGRVEAMRKVLVIPRVSGVIEAVPFKEGSLVKEGDVLFEIEKTRYEATVKSANAKLMQLDAEIAYARKTYERQQGLLEKKAISEDEVENAHSILEKLIAQRLAAEAELTLAEEDLRYCTIKAPFKGRVGRLSQSQGQYITPSQSLVTLTEENPIYITFSLSESDLLNLFGNIESLKDQAVLSINTANGSPYKGSEGRIVITDNEVNPMTDTLKVWSQFENKDHILQSGSIVTVNLKRKDNETVPIVPLTAIQYDKDGAFVYVVGEGDTAVRRNIIPGEITGYSQSVYDGLKEAETVIIDGSHKVRPGAKIKPVYKTNKN